MKKYIALVVGMIFVLGFAASAFAIHAEIPSETQAVVAKGQVQMTLDGDIRIRGEMNNNTDFNKDTADYYSAYDERVRLGLTAKVTPNTTGRIALESSTNGADNVDEYLWGQSNVPGGLNTATVGIYPRGNSKRGSLNIIEAWILHTGSGLLGVPAGIKVGHMALALGNGLFFSHTKFGDDAIVLFADPTKEIHTALLTAKFAEGNAKAGGAALLGAGPLAATGNDDADAYVGLIVYKPAKDMSFSFDATLVNDQVAGINSLHQVNTATDGTQLWNFGLRGDMNISGIGIKADVELQAGKSKNMALLTTNNLGIAAANGNTGDIKHSGYAGLLSLDYTFEPVKITLAGAYGSGDNNADDNKNRTFVTSLDQDEPHYTLVYEHRTNSAANAGVGAGLANTAYIKLGADANLMKDLSAGISGYWLRAAKKVALNNATDANGALEGKRALGSEIDANIKYAIDKNLNYWVEGGYLFAGSAYDIGTGVAGANKSSDNAYMVRHGIQLSF